MSTSLTISTRIGFAERHRALAALVAVLALVGVGIISGEIIGTLLVQVIELFLGQVGGGVPR